MSPDSPDTDPDAPLLIGNWRVDPRADELRGDGRTIKLEPLRMRLLMALARHPGQVVLSSELLDTVWNGVIVTPSSLYQSVAQLRQQLGDDPAAPRYIETVPRKGYRLIAPVSALPPGLADDPARPAADGLPPTRAVSAEAALPAAPPARLPRLHRRVLLMSVAGGVVLAGGALWWRNRPSRPPLRIAVLPFSDRSAAGLDQPLAHGVTDDVIRELGRHPALEVMSFDAVLRLGSSGEATADAYRLLAAAYALRGELVRSGDKVNLVTRLLALPGSRLRSEQSFDATMERTANLPAAVAAKVLEALDLDPVAAPNTAVTTSAYEMYVLGIDALRAKTPASVENARQYFTRGTEIDSLYARNYSGLASSWIVQAEVGGAQLDWKEAYARAEPLYAKAVRLEPGLVEARLGLANVARQYQRYEEARRTYEAVIADHPNNIQAHFGLALTEENEGWPSRAIAHYERAAALDPTHFLIPLRSGLALMYSGRLPEAQARFERSIALDGTRPNGFYGLGILQWLRGRLDESVAAYREALKRGEQLAYVWVDYAFVCVDLGLFSEARRAFGRTVALLKPPNPVVVEEAFVWLAEGANGPAPAALREKTASPAPWERLLILTMAGERPTAADVRSVENETAGYVTPTTSLYEIVKGRFRALDMASLFAAAGLSDRSGLLLDEVEQTLNHYQQRGVVAPALDFHRSRAAALRGDSSRALASLQRAVDGGWRRSWWVRRDPALAQLRNEKVFSAALARIDAQLAAQRKSVGE